MKHESFTEEQMRAVGKSLAWLPLSLLLALFVGAYCTFAVGFVIAKLWLWFAVPLGAPIVSWATFGAGTLAWNVARNKMPKAEPADAREPNEKLIAVVAFFVAPWMALALGWWMR